MLAPKRLPGALQVTRGCHRTSGHLTQPQCPRKAPAEAVLAKAPSLQRARSGQAGRDAAARRAQPLPSPQQSELLADLSPKLRWMLLDFSVRGSGLSAGIRALHVATSALAWAHVGSWQWLQMATSSARVPLCRRRGGQRYLEAAPSHAAPLVPAGRWIRAERGSRSLH